jgi:hypothetical protein
MTRKAKPRRHRDAPGQVQKLPDQPAKRANGKASAASGASRDAHPALREAPIAKAARVVVNASIADGQPGQWDVLNDMYLSMTKLMDHWITRAAPVISNPVLLAHVREKEDYSALLGQFRCDMEQLTKELVELHRVHAGKTGGTDDPDENLHAALLFEQYVVWQLRHDQTLIPIVNHLLEFTHDAELALARERVIASGRRDAATGDSAADVAADGEGDTQVLEDPPPGPGP